MSDEHDVRRYIEAYRSTTVDEVRLAALGARIGDAAFAGGLAPAAVKPKLAAVAKVLGGLLLVAGAASLWAASPDDRVSTSSESEATRAAQQQPPLEPETATPEADRPTPIAVPEPAVVETRAPIATVPATKLESPQPPRRRVTKVRATSAPEQERAAVEAPDDSLAAELRLIKAARRQLETNVDAALDSLRRHEARFGSDAVFAAERIALLAVAQCRDGRVEDGQATIARLRRLFPGHAGTRRAVRNCAAAKPSGLSELK